MAEKPDFFTYHMPQLHHLGPTSATQECEKDELAAYSNWTQEPEGDISDLNTLASLSNFQKFEEKLERERTSVSMKNKEGWTPLMYACFYGNCKNIELLLQNGAEKDTRNPQGQTALMILAYHGYCEPMKFFTEETIINAVDDKGWTALFHAVNGGHLNAVNTLLENGADVNKVDKITGMTVVMMAALEGKESMVKFILNKGADPTIKSHEGETLKSLAIHQGYDSLAKVVEHYLPPEPAKEVGAGRNVGNKEPWQPHQEPPIEKVETHLPTPNNMECPTNVVLQLALREINLSSVLKFYDLDKYKQNFEKQNIDLGVFLSLTEDDLRNLGIKLFGPRRKLSLVIQHFNGCRMCQMVIQQQYQGQMKLEFENEASSLFPSN